jgi:hypothetical protein
MEMDAHLRANFPVKGNNFKKKEDLKRDPMILANDGFPKDPYILESKGVKKSRRECSVTFTQSCWNLLIFFSNLDIVIPLRSWT